MQLLKGLIDMIPVANPDRTQSKVDSRMVESGCVLGVCSVVHHGQTNISVPAYQAGVLVR